VRKYIPKDLGWKVGSLVLALLIWLAYSAEPNSRTQRTIPVLYQGVGQGLWVTAVEPDHVRVEVQGPSARLSADNLDDAALRLNLTDLQSAGTRSFAIRATDLILPHGVEFVRATPAQVRIRLEPVMTKEIPVHPRFTQSVADGVRVSVTPELVRVVGPASRVSRIDFAETDPLSPIPGNRLKAHVFLSDDEVMVESNPEVSVTVQ
jgi:YbbR domain-containing protein